MAFVPPARHLLRAKDLVDSRYFEPLGVDDLAGAAGLSRAHFSREFRKAFGESPYAYLLTRRLERAAALLRMTDRPVAEICLSVGLRSLGSFTTSFTRTYGMSPLTYRAAHPPAASHALVPACVVRATAEEVRRLMAKGFAGTIFLRTDDCHASYEELSARGVEFVDQPFEQPYGIDSSFRDPSGNHIRLTQVRELAAT